MLVVAIAGVVFLAAPHEARLEKTGDVVPMSTTTHHRYTNARELFCLDDSRAYGLRAWPCKNNQNQVWELTYFPGGGTYELKNSATGRCVDDSARYGLRAIACNGYAFQRWNFAADEPYFGNIQTNKCIDYSRQYGLRTARCTNADFQRWLG